MDTLVSISIRLYEKITSSENCPEQPLGSDHGKYNCRYSQSGSQGRREKESMRRCKKTTLPAVPSGLVIAVVE